MYSAMALGLISFVLCMLLTPICRRLALHWDLVDKPDEKRKLHARSVPRLGGLPIFISFAGAILLLLEFTPVKRRLHVQHQTLLWSLLPAAGIVFLTGLLDDLLTLKPWQKLAGQVAGASLLAISGTRISLFPTITLFGHHVFASPWITAPLSVIWLVGCSNALNLIDGMDGLASGVGLFATITTLLAAVFTGNIGLILATMPLAGALLAFLQYNFSPASIFLGDCGSLTIGFLLGCFGLVWGQHGGSLLAMTGPLMTLALPLLDVGLAVVRRSLRSVPIFSADRGHIHHMMLARGFKPGQAALILYGVCSVAASLALLQSIGSAYLHVAVVLTFMVLIWAGINYLDYVEIGAARRTVSGRRLLRSVRSEIYLHDMEHQLSQARDDGDYWEVVRRIGADMQFDVIELQLKQHLFREVSSDVYETTLLLAWNITLPLGEHGHLMLARKSHNKPECFAMSTIERLQEELIKRMQPQTTVTHLALSRHSLRAKPLPNPKRV